MNRSLLASSLLIVALASSALADSPPFPAPAPAAPVTTQPAAVPAAPAVAPTPTIASTTAQYEGQFLGFVLDKAKTYSGKAEDVIGKAVDAAEVEAKPLMEQYLTWCFLHNALDIGLPVLFFLPFSIIFYRSVKRWTSIVFDPANSRDNDGRYPWIPTAAGPLYGSIWGAIICGTGTAVSGIFVLCNLDGIYQMVEIRFAPHVFLVQQVLNLLHNQ